MEASRESQNVQSILGKIDFSKYIDLPFAECGRDFNGVDCYGIPFLIYKEEANIILPDFLELKYDLNWAKHGENHILENIDDNWDYIIDGNYKRLDIHIFYDSDGVASHVGVNIGNRKFIHVINDTSSVVSKLSLWEKRLHGTLRFRGLYAKNNV